MGQRGRVGVRLDRGLDTEELCDLLTEAHRVVASKALTALREN